MGASGVLELELQPADANELAGASTGQLQLVVDSELREPGLSLYDVAGPGEVDDGNGEKRLVAVNGPGAVTLVFD